MPIVCHRRSASSLPSRAANVSVNSQISDLGSYEAHLNLGIALADSFDLNEALVAFNEAARLAPNSPGAGFSKGRLLFQLQRYVEAKNELERVCRLTPNHSQAFYYLALVETQLGHYSASAERLHRFIALEPANSRGYYQLGQMRMRLGNRKGAIANWKKAVQIDPSYGKVLYNLFRTLRNDKPEEAQQYQERFQAVQREKQITNRADTLGNFALASLQAGDWAEATEQLKEAIEICGRCRTKFLLHKNLGLIYARSGDLQNAEPELRLAAKLAPDDPEVQQSLKTIEQLRHGEAAKP